MLVKDVKTITNYVLLCCSLLFASARATEWTIETVDSTETGLYSSLRIDKDGNAHVTYVVGGQNELRYAFWDHLQKKWFTMPVDINASFCSLTLDSKQRPHISYAEAGTASGSRLRYARWDGSKWSKEAIPLDSDIIGFYTSIALDTADRPNISFYEYRGRKGTDLHIRLRVVSWTGQYWEVRTVDGSEGSGKYNSMAADAAGQLRLAYANVHALTPGARMATWNGKEWRLEIVDDRTSSNGDTVGVSMAMALDKGGAPHLCYRDTNAMLMKYAMLSNGRWVTEMVDSLVTAPPFTDRNSITVDDAGRPYISYYDGRSGELRLAHKEGVRWLIEVVDSGFAGLTSSIQLGRGVIWVSYGDETNHLLKVARRTIETPVSNGRDGNSATSTPAQATEPKQLGLQHEKQH